MADHPSIKKEDYSNLLTALLPSPSEEPFHLSADELSVYANDELEELDREDVTSHLEVCDQCRLKTEEMRTANLAGASWWKVHVLQSRPVQIGALVLLTLTLIGFAVWRARNRQEPLQAPLQDGSPRQEGHASASPSPIEPQRETEEVVLRLDDGGRELALNKNGELKGVDHLPQSLQRTIKAILVNQALDKPADLEELGGKSSVLMGGSDDGRPFELIGPIASVLPHKQPTFRWRPLKGASGYVVSVMDARLDEVVTSEVLTTVEWRSPRKLRGGIYSWQVTAIRDGQRIVSPALPAPQAKFKILEPRSVAELARARRDFPESHLALGVLLTRAGLLDEATREFELLQKANPRSPLVKKLLDQLQTIKTAP